MHDTLQAAMAEATRLTRAGRLTEATAMIQRALGGRSPAPDREAQASSLHAPRIVDADLNAPTRPLPGSASRRSIPSTPDMPPYTSSRGARPFPSQEPIVSARSQGQFIKKAYTTVEGTRSYHLYIPSGYHGQAVPLVVMLHGCTQNPWDFAAGTGMNALAERETFLVAYPEQPSSANGSKCWNWFQQSDQYRHRGEPALIAGMTQEVMKEYRLQQREVYVAGLSSGGAMAIIMAATYPDLYAAVGVHSGLAYGAAYDLPSAFAAMKQGVQRQGPRLHRTIPLIVFHGDSDTTVAPINADCIVKQWLQGLEDASSARSRSARAARIERGQVVGGHAYTRSIYHDVTGRAIVEKWQIHQAGHAWSGGSPAGSYTDPQGPDATAEMFRFFKEHARS